MRAAAAPRGAAGSGLSRDFVIYDSSDQVAVVKQAQQASSASTTSSCRRDRRCRGSARPRTAWKAPDALRGAWNIRDEQIAKIYERYVTALRDANALDFDDLLLKTVELFETSEPVREFYARKFKYVMVDEYQDTNRPQYLLIRRAGRDPSQPRRRRRSRSVDLQVARRRPAQHPRLRDTTFPTPRSSGSSRTTARRRSSSTRRPRSSARIATARTSGSGPTARAAPRIVYYRGNDELEEADFITRSIKQARAEDVDAHDGRALPDQRAVARD